jgi:hypothetical protein
MEALGQLVETISLLVASTVKGTLGSPVCPRHLYFDVIADINRLFYLLEHLLQH